ncbi:MAG TPA: HAMP domain-containing sensor histidine kinase [Anaerolineales bacterium]|nr:HAMP domain-containing sensor histidine kinase [Anaerolineales bacterium]
MILTDAANLLTASPGSLVYHLTLSVCLALLFSLSRVLRLQVPGQAPLRWSVASGALLALRLASMTIAGLAWLLLIDGNLILPPLDRFLSLTGLTIIGWASLFPRSDRAGDATLLGLLGLGIVGLAATVAARELIGETSAFNQSWADLAWSLAGLLLVLAVAMLTLLRRPVEWEWSMSAWALLILGYSAHLILGDPNASLAGYIRLAELSAYPVLVIGAVRSLTQVEATQQRVSGLTPSSAVGLQVATADAVAGLLALLNIERTSDLVTHSLEAVCRALRAEYCLLINPPNSAGEFPIASGYDLIRERLIPGAQLDSRHAPKIHNALLEKRAMTIQDDDRSPDCLAIQDALGLPTSGPALILPLVADDELLGGLLLLSPYARRTWTDRELIGLRPVASHLARRFQRLRTSGIGHVPPVEPGLPEAQARIRALEEENARLEHGFRAARQTLEQAQAAPSSEHDAAIDQLLAKQQQAVEVIQVLESEIERLKQAQLARPSLTPTEEVVQLETTLQGALEELATSRARLAGIEAQAEFYRHRGAAPMSDLNSLTTIVQDIRQPMASIIGYTDLLLGESVGILGSMQRKFLERVRAGIGRMAEMLNDLIQASLLDAGGLNLSPGPVDLMYSIEEVVTKVSQPLREKNIALRLDIPDNLPPIQGDQDAIIQILSNLMTNATGASPMNGEIVVRAELQETPEGKYLLLAVSDEGEGIQASELGHIFHRVYDTGDVTMRGLGEGGVGLPIVKALSEAIGGRVWVESQVGAGSTFTVLMPAATPADLEVEPSEQSA